MKGKSLAVWFAGSCLLALAIATVFLRNAIIEGYYIHALGSSDPVARLGAVEELARRRSLRALPHLVRLLEEEPLERVEFSESDSPELSVVRLTPILHAIYVIGQAGRPAVEAAIGENAGVWRPGVYNTSWLLTHVKRAWEKGGSGVGRMEYSRPLDGDR